MLVLSVLITARKQTIQGEKQFDFLRDLVANIPDVNPCDEDGDSQSPSCVEPGGAGLLPTVPTPQPAATAPRPRGR